MQPVRFATIGKVAVPGIFQGFPRPTLVAGNPGLSVERGLGASKPGAHCHSLLFFKNKPQGASLELGPQPNIYIYIYICVYIYIYLPDSWKTKGTPKKAKQKMKRNDEKPRLEHRDCAGYISLAGWLGGWVSTNSEDEVFKNSFDTV